MIKNFHAWDFKPNLYHFRTYAGAEVDLVIELNGKLFPIMKCVLIFPPKVLNDCRELFHLVNSRQRRPNFLKAGGNHEI